MTVNDGNSTSSDGFTVIDVTSSTNPSRMITASNATAFGDFPLGLSGSQSLTLAGNYLYLSIPDSDALEIIDVSGASISNAEIGGAKVDNLQVMNRAQFDNSVSIRNGLTVGAPGLQLIGNFGMYAPTTSAATGTSISNVMRFSHTAQFILHASSTTQCIYFADAYAPSSSTSRYLLSVRNKPQLFSIATTRCAAGQLRLFDDDRYYGQPGDLAEQVDIAPGDAAEPGCVVRSIGLIPTGKYAVYATATPASSRPIRRL